MKTVQSKRPLRVLQFICPTGFYGAEGWVLALSNSLDPTVVISQLAVTKESENHNLVLTKKFRELGLLTHEIQMSGRFDVRAVFRLCEIIRNQEIDVIHTHGYKSDIIGLVAAKRAGIKCVCTPHGFENSNNIKMKVFIAIGCRVFKYFDAVAPLSEALCRDVARYGVIADKIKYIPNGVDLKPIIKYFDSRKLNSQVDSDTEYNKFEKEFTIGYIGQLIDRKNIRDMLEIFNQLCMKHDNLKLVLVGDGEQREELELQSSRLACADRIVFKGYVDQPLQELGSFDLFMMTSTLEGIPRCLMEAMAMLVPIVSYDIPGVDQLIAHDETGMLADLHDIDSMVSRCDEMILNRDKATRLSKRASDLVWQKYSASAMAENYANLFGKICEH